MKENLIRAKIEDGAYKGKPLVVNFGRPLKVLIDGKDITEWLVALNIRLDASGQVVYLKLAELNYSQVPKKTWSRMVDDKIRMEG